MEVKYSYSKKQLELAVDYIATHNPHFLGQHHNIYSRITNTMISIVKDFPNCYYKSTMGFLVQAIDIEEFSLCGQDSVHFEFFVDPAVGNRADAGDDDTEFNTQTINS